MSKGQKTVTHHTIPVITSKKIGKQYDITGKELSETRAKLEFLGYLRAIRLGSHTYELLKPTIPEYLEDLEQEYVADRYTYILPQAYIDVKAQLIELAEEIGKHANMAYESDLKEKFTQAYTDLADALQMLPDGVLPAEGESEFICLPLHDEVVLGSPLSRQRRLENIINLLKAIRRLDLTLGDAVQISYAVELLSQIRIPSRITERLEAIKCAA